MGWKAVIKVSSELFQQHWSSVLSNSSIIICLSHVATALMQDGPYLHSSVVSMCMWVLPKNRHQGNHSLQWVRIHLYRLRPVPHIMINVSIKRARHCVNFMYRRKFSTTVQIRHHKELIHAYHLQYWADSMIISRFTLCVVNFTLASFSSWLVLLQCWTFHVFKNWSCLCCTGPWKTFRLCLLAFSRSFWSSAFFLTLSNARPSSNLPQNRNHKDGSCLEITSRSGTASCMAFRTEKIILVYSNLYCCRCV